MRVKSWLPVCGLALCLLIEPSIAGQFEDGLAAQKAGDYPTALRIWKQLAEESNVAAQFNLAALYAKGQGVPQNDAEALN
jgi:TPR repeat protein